MSRVKRKPRFTKFSEYADYAVVTLNRLETIEDDEFHMLMGMSGEFGEIVDCLKKHWAYGAELDRTNLKEEIGDYCWYIASTITLANPEEENRLLALSKVDRIIEAHNEDLPSFNYKNSPSESKMYVKTLIEKGPQYNLGDLFNMMNLAHIFEIDFLSCLLANINKLMRRYEGKFTAKEAMSRDLKKEKKALES